MIAIGNHALTNRMHQPMPNRSRAHSILIVDDDPNNLKVALGHLDAYGYEVLIARDGERGIERARAALPQLILLDVVMPGIDGYEVCRRLKSHPATSDIPVLFMTGQTSMAEKLEGFDVGAVDYITKPVAERELLARVRTHIQLYTLRARLEEQAALLEQAVSWERAQRETDRQDLVRSRATIRAQGEQLEALANRWMQASPDGSARPLSAFESVVQAHARQARSLLEPAAGERMSEAAAAACQHLDIIVKLYDHRSLHDQAGAGRGAPEVPAGPNPFTKLSPREREIVEMLLRGCSNKEIAIDLSLSQTTVSSHRGRIMNKLEVDSLPALVKLALRHGVDS